MDDFGARNMLTQNYNAEYKRVFIKRRARHRDESSYQVRRLSIFINCCVFCFLNEGEGDVVED